MIVKIPIYILLILHCIDGSFSSDKTSRLLAELELTDLELADDCEDLTSGLKSALLAQDNGETIRAARKAHGHLLRAESKNLKTYDDIPSEVERNWTLLVKPGDGLLSETDWNTLVFYHNAHGDLARNIQVPCLNDSDECVLTKREYRTILKKSKSGDLLKNAWFSWQHIDSNIDPYSTILQLLKKAAALNEKEDVASYWEYLNEFDGGYSKARGFWEEIKPLYIKLHEFVRRRLFNYYKLNDTSAEIPVYLLGSDMGEDWSYIADIVLPHPQLHYDAESFLKYKNIEEIYSLAEYLSDTVTLGKLGDDFWVNSRFNMTFCEPQILSFCSQEYSEVYVCNETSWTIYLDAHETVFNIGLRNRDYGSLMRQSLRYSPIDDAVITLGSLLAIESLPYHGIVDKDVFDEASNNNSATMTKLLLTALRVLPKLPYYLAADEWRLKELETPSENVAVSWWQFRNEYQRIKGVSGGEVDFLNDKFVVSNKPYLSKFLGIILAFQFMDYYRNQMADPTNNLAEEIGKDPNFLSMIRERPTTDWIYLVTINYGFDLSPSSLLEYFKPLEKYLENAPMEQAPILTTTTTTTTTTPKPTTSSKPYNDTDLNKGRILNGSWPADAILNDSPEMNFSMHNPENEKHPASNATMYAGVGLLGFVSVLLVVAYGYKHIRRRRRRTNNRRFAT